MKNGSFYMIVFPSAHLAIQAEKIISEHMPVRIMPTLREVSASCGISLRVEEVDFTGVPESVGSHLLFYVSPPSGAVKIGER